jgi:hypothetical protein
MPDLGYTLIEYSLKSVGVKKNVPSTPGGNLTFAASAD